MGGAKAKMVATAAVRVVLDEGRLVREAELVVILNVVHLVFVREEDASLCCPVTQTDNFMLTLC
jgi:hypothetical protein